MRIRVLAARRRVGYLFLISVLNACPASGLWVPPPEKPLNLRDAKTSELISDVLVLPRYSAAKNMTLGKGQTEVFLAHPFRYDPTNPFRPYVGDTSGFYVPGLFVGRAVKLDGIVVVADGYEPKWIWNLWERDLEGQFQLAPLRGDEKGVYVRIRTLLQKDQLIDEERRLWSLGGSRPIHVRFTDQDRELCESFLNETIGPINAT